MTQDEFNVMKAKQLLLDPVLCNVLDTTLRIAVGNDFYKITSQGTFVTTKGNEAELYDVIQNFENFNQNMNITNEDVVVSITPAVKFINSFRYASIDDGLVKSTTSAYSSAPYYSEFNVDSYKWESRLWIGRAWDKIFGTDASREVKLPSGHYVKLHLYNVDYGFFASAGMKVKLEKEKKFLGLPYRVDETADNIAIGYDRFRGTLKLNLPAIPVQTASDAVNAVESYLNGQLKKFIYKGYNDMDFMKDFSTTILNFMPSLNLPFGQTQINNYLQTSAQSFLNTAIPNAVYDCLKGFTGTYVKALNKYIDAKQPRQLFVMNNTKEITSFMTGVIYCGRGSSKVIRWDTSFGINLSLSGNGSLSIGPYLPSSYNIEDIDVFAAVLYNGQWKGIRFYN